MNESHIRRIIKRANVITRLGKAGCHSGGFGLIQSAPDRFERDGGFHAESGLSEQRLNHIGGGEIEASWLAELADIDVVIAQRQQW